MKICKWVDMGRDVEVEISAEDIRCALSEAFACVTQDPLGEELPNTRTVLRALNSVASFFNAFTDEQILQLSEKQREIVGKFLATAAERFKVGA